MPICKRLYLKINKRRNKNSNNVLLKMKEKKVIKKLFIKMLTVDTYHVAEENV